MRSIRLCLAVTEPAAKGGVDLSAWDPQRGFPMKNGGLTGKNGGVTGKNGGLTGKNGGLTMEMLVKWDILYISVHEYTPFTMKNGETMMSSNHIRPDDLGAWAVCSDMFWHVLRFLVCHFCYFSMRFPPKRYPLR